MLFNMNLKSIKDWFADPFGNKKIDAEVKHIKKVLSEFTDDELISLVTCFDQLDQLRKTCWYIEVANRWLEPKIKEKLNKTT